MARCNLLFFAFMKPYSELFIFGALFILSYIIIFYLFIIYLFIYLFIYLSIYLFLSVWKLFLPTDIIMHVFEVVSS